MKIFANNFCLELVVESASRQFSYPSLPAEEVRRKLLLADLPFEGKVFHSPGAGSLEQVWLTHTALSETDTAAHWVLTFGTEQNRKAFLADYMSRFKYMAAAGGLVFTPEGELLLMRRRGRWDLPKGKVEKGEGIADAAWREVEEETGLQLHKITSPLPDSYHIFPQKGKWVWKTTFWFRMETPVAEKLIPQVEEDIEELVWTPLAELRKGFPQEMFPLITDVIRGVMPSER
jgi:8-oxo-dGTP pyrophosphatase MutT (NUDIX family)